MWGATYVQSWYRHLPLPLQGGDGREGALLYQG